MKKLIKFNLLLSAIVAIMAFSSFTDNYDPEYTEMIVSAHPEYCNVYYINVYVGDNFQLSLAFLCPYEMCFNPRILVCDFPDEAHFLGDYCNRATEEDIN